MFDGSDGGVTDQALETCNAYTQTKLEEMLQVASFMKKLCQIETEHAASLQKLLEKQPPHQEHAELFQSLVRAAHKEGGPATPQGVDAIPLAGLWSCVLEDVKMRGLRQEKLAKQLSDEVVAPLTKLHGELDAGRRELMTEGQALIKRLHDEHSGLRSLRAQQHPAVKATEEASSKVSKAQNTPWRREREVRKARDRYDKASAAQVELEKALHLKEGQCEEMQREVHTLRLPELIKKLQQQESSRAGLMFAAFEQLHVEERLSADAARDSSFGLATAIGLTDADLDAQVLAAWTRLSLPHGSGCPCRIPAACIRLKLVALALVLDAHSRLSHAGFIGAVCCS